MNQLLWICLGGAIGTGARHLLSTWVSKLLGPSLPFGTLAVNLVGSFVVALIVQAGGHAAAISPALRIVLVTGVMGGFTTYSAFSLQTVVYLQSGAWGSALLYVGVTVVGCLAACQLGFTCARALLG
jgi:CrcB protein